jgi:hypothetical protein
MSNWALSKCTYSWILKVEGDVIALPTLKDMIRGVLDENKPIYAGLVILNVAGRDMDKISWENPRNGGWDECIVPNNYDLAHFVRRSKWEVLEPQGLPTVSLGWALMHLKRSKSDKADGWNGEHYVDFNRDTVALALQDYNNRVGGYPGADNKPLGHPCLFSGEWKQHL